MNKRDRATGYQGIARWCFLVFLAGGHGYCILFYSFTAHSGTGNVIELNRF